MSEKIIRNLLRALRGEISPGAIQNVMREAERAMEAKIVTFPSPDPKRERTAAKARIHTTVAVHEAGDLPIYAHGGMFYAFVGPEEEGRGVEADTLGGCKDRAIAAWRLYSPVVWRRAIHVMFERTRPAQYTPSDQTAGISITACRYWHGTRFDGTVRTVPMRDWSLSQPVEVREHARFLGVPLPTVDNRGVGVKAKKRLARWWAHDPPPSLRSFARWCACSDDPELVRLAAAWMKIKRMT